MWHWGVALSVCFTRKYYVVYRERNTIAGDQSDADFHWQLMMARRIIISWSPHCSLWGIVLAEVGPAQRVTSAPALFWEQVLHSGWHLHLLFSRSWPATVFFGEAMFIGVMSNFWTGLYWTYHMTFSPSDVLNGVMCWRLTACSGSSACST